MVIEGREASAHFYRRKLQTAMQAFQDTKSQEDLDLIRQYWRMYRQSLKDEIGGSEGTISEIMEIALQAVSNMPEQRLMASNDEPEGSNIKRRRKVLGLTLAEVAKRMNTSRSQVDKMERGERRLTVEWLKKLCLALDCTPLELLPNDLQAMTRDSQLHGFDGYCEISLQGTELILRMEMPSEYKMLNIRAES